MPPKGRTLTEAQRQNLRERGLAQAQRRREASTAVMERPAVEEGAVLESEDTVLAFLTDVSDRYKASKGKRSAQAKVVKEALAVINSLDAHAYPELFADEGFQNLLEAFTERQKVPGQEELPPGATMRKGPFIEDKRPWRWDDIREGRLKDDGEPWMVWVDYSPRGLPGGSQYVNWNGLEFIFKEDVTVHVPKCFVDVLEESYRGMKRAAAHADYLFKQANTVPDMNLLDPATIRIRGMMTGGAINKSGAGSQWEADAYCKELEARLGGEEGDEGEAA